jgi:ADP-ribosyl-[dinitrogen reductase] hydrolase
MRAPTKAVIADRSAGTAVASAAGDALGAPHEFGGPLPESTQLGMTGGGTFGWMPGEWTDDTQMALAILTPLAGGDGSVSAVEDGLLAWFASGPRDVGSQTSAALRSGAPLVESAARYQLGNPEGAGNGGLMRIGPAGLSFPGQAEAIATYARGVTELTHPHVDCLDASQIWAAAIDRTIHAAPASDQPWDFAGSIRSAVALIPEVRRARWMQLIDEACERPAVDFYRTNGWVIHAFQAALSAIVRTPVPDGPAPSVHLVAAIESAVRSGGDTDTVAAIAGSLLGARWGASAVPMRWTSMLHGKRVYGDPGLTAADVDGMARRAAQAGRADKAGWPGVARLVPHYLEHWEPGPSPVNLEGAQFGGVGGLAPALAGGADVVVSLCRMGTQDVPDGVEHQVVGLIDGGSDDNPNLAFVLADTADFIATRVDAGRSVYVHCVAAQNRTPTVAAAFLARHRGMSVDRALDAAEGALHHRPTPLFVQGVREAATV